MIRYIPSPCLCNDASYAPVYQCPIKKIAGYIPTPSLSCCMICMLELREKVQHYPVV